MKNLYKKVDEKFLLRIFLLSVLISISQVLHAAIIYVDASKTTGSNNGSSWNDAFTSLQSALDSAIASDQIWVAKGTYKPSSSYDLTNTSVNYHFRMKNDVAIYGGFAGNEGSSYDLSLRNFTQNETILSGDFNDNDVVSGIGQSLTISNNNENCYHVFYHPSGTNLTATAILDGFTIQGGNTVYAAVPNAGGAMYNYSSSPTLSNLIFKYNKSIIGGAICNTEYSSPGISNTRFFKNYASFGGAIYNGQYSSPVIDNVIFSSNTASDRGGSINNNNSSSTVKNSKFELNWAMQGGSIMYYICSASTISNSIFISNGAYQAGAVYNYSTPLIINNTTFVLNTGSVHSGFMYNSSSAAITSVNNCIIWGNSAPTGAQLTINSGSLLTMNYSCYANGVGDIDIRSGTFTATNNNITNDPNFVNSQGNDFRIYNTSPCADSGNDDYCTEVNDIRGTGYGRKLLKTNHNQTGSIDMGAYEYKEGTDPYIVCINPTSGGTIGSDQTGNGTFDPVEITSSTLPTGYTGTLQYKWQQSTTSNNSGFTDIAGSNSASYDPGMLTQSTWFKRLARVECASWTNASESNVVKMTVNTPAITLTSTKNGNLSFDLKFNSSGTFFIDWGTGAVAQTASTSRTTYSTTTYLSGNTIKVYGSGIIELRANAKNLTSLDVSACTTLTGLECYTNQLTTFDVTKNTALTKIYCDFNQLSELDFSKNTVLTILSCSQNQLTTLDISKNTALTFFDCSLNQLTALDVSNNVEITDLYCDLNQLSNLDVSNNTLLTLLSCSQNKLTTLDVSKNTVLSELYCHENQLNYASLPGKKPEYTTYTYAPQAILAASATDNLVDLSTQLIAIDENDVAQTTIYSWYTKSGTTLTSGIDYREENGVFTFLKNPSDSVYCTLENAAFPEFTGTNILRTVNLVCFNQCTACSPLHVEVQKTALAPNLDGIIDTVWDNFEAIPITKNYVGESPTVEVYWKTMWDNNGIYVLIDVQDNDHYPSWEAGSSETWMYDQVEIFFDVNGNLKDGLGPNVQQGHYGYSPTFFDGGYDGTFSTGPVLYGNKLYGEGYVSEMFFPYTSFVNKDGQTMSKMSFLMLDSIGFDVQIVDRDEDVISVKGRKVWQNIGLIDENYLNMDDAGTIRLVGEDPYTDTRNDSLALVALYNSTGGENWIRKANWLTGPLSTWENVTVQNGRVVMLNFGWNNNMIGTLPNEIGNLTAIKWFVAPNNEGLTGTIPAAIGNLTNLENLSFFNCNLSGNIPEVLLNLNKLAAIELSNNNFDAAPVPDFGQLTQLRTLTIDNCNFTGDIPASLSNLTHLESLSMNSNTGLNAGPIPNLSASLNLYNIDFAFCNRTGNIPAWLSSLTNLWGINLGNNQLEGTIPQDIGNLANLKYLYFDNNKLTGAIPTGISNLRNLLVLWVNGNDLSGDMPDISGLTQLTALRVNRNKFTFANMAAIENLPASLADFGYAPQDTLLGIHKEGNMLTALDCGHANNYIRWYRDGSLKSSNAPTCETDESGNYYYTVTNSDFNLLTLYSDTLYVDVAAIPIDLQIPSTTVASSTEECFNAENDITVAGTGLVVIQEDATATFIAGHSIRFLPGFHAESGSIMHAFITTDGSFCDVAGGGSVVAQPEIKSTRLAETNVVSLTANELQVKVYPNPSNGKFTVELNDTEPDITAIIYDLSGSAISRSTSYNTNQLGIELSGIRKGIYFIRIMSGTKRFGRKIIIE